MFTQLMDKYGIPRIKILAYNSKANRVVERGHFIIREGILKACAGNVNKWPDMVVHAFFCDKVTTRRQTGFSPFYMLHGVHPVLPFDLAEASFLVTFHNGMSATDLIAARIRQLQKRPKDLEAAAETLRRNRMKDKEAFEKRFHTRLVHDQYTPGTLVLIRNSAIEKEMDRKSKPRYNGPYEVYRRTQNGSYVLKELSGETLRHSIAAFRVVPYISRNNTQLLEELFGKGNYRDPHPESDSEESTSDATSSDQATESSSSL